MNFEKSAMLEHGGPSGLRGTVDMSGSMIQCKPQHPKKRLPGCEIAEMSPSMPSSGSLC